LKEEKKALTTAEFHAKLKANSLTNRDRLDWACRNMFAADRKEFLQFLVDQYCFECGFRKTKCRCVN